MKKLLRMIRLGWFGRVVCLAVAIGVTLATVHITICCFNELCDPSVPEWIRDWIGCADTPAGGGGSGLQ